MFRASLSTPLVTALLLGAALVVTAPAAAQSKADARSQSAKKPKAGKPAPKAKAKKGRAVEAEPAPEVIDADAPDPEVAAAAASAPKADGSGESGVKAAGTGAQTSTTKTVKGVKEEETAAGVKTYEFGAVEVEGRLRSPQILYFLRRVRAEFDAAALGHRSFLRELTDTRNNPAFR